MAAPVTDRSLSQCRWAPTCLHPHFTRAMEMAEVLGWLFLQLDACDHYSLANLTRLSRSATPSSLCTGLVRQSCSSRQIKEAVAVLAPPPLSRG